MKQLHNIKILFFTTLFSLSIARDTITPTQPLFDNETLVSSGNRFALGFFTPANSANRYVGIWYNNIADQTIVWVANRVNPVTNSSGLLSITSEGVLKIVDENSVVIWSVNTTGLTNPVARLLDTGNLVIKDRDATGNYAWEGFNTPTDTILPGMKIRADRTAGLNHSLRSWKSDTDPSPGAYYAYMDISGDPELYLCSVSEKIWRTGAWNGVEFSGSPNSSSREGLFHSLVNYSEGMVYSFSVSNDSVLSRIVINGSGLVQRSVWLWDINQWNIFWYAPKDPCDNYGQCGTYGACDTDNSQTCECLPAFAPKNPTNWALRDGSDGCIRKTRLDCENETDGFVAVRNVKLPDSTNCTVNRSLSLDECREMCLRNCSCTAYASADVSGGGSGCIIWVSELVDIRVYVGAGQDLYVRLAAADIASYLQSQKHKSKKVGIIVGLLSGTLLLSCVGCFLWKRKKMRRVILGATNFSGEKLNEGKRGRDLDPPFFEFGGGMDFPVFDFGTIADATDFFLEGNKLGEGGFGPVYKGKLGEHQEIAVKRLATSSQQGTEEFKNEVMLIAKLQNVNLVRLLGCCVQGEERMLIYEYMPNKSLDAFLFDKEKAALLDWETRYKIIVGISRGLLYLHHDSRYRIIHRDLKASNILLDEEMNPKISDFGMARLFGGNVTDYNTRKVVGTYGYMSPEYAMQGIFSLKSDVFSFGVLLLEIVSGKRNRGSYAFSSHPNLVAHAWSLWNEGESLKVVDDSTSEIFPRNEVLKCIQIGLLCVQEHPEDRPLMSAVILMFGADITSLQQPKQPGFIARMCSLDSDKIPNLQDLCTSNELTVTIFGR